MYSYSRQVKLPMTMILSSNEQGRLNISHASARQGGDDMHGVQYVSHFHNTQVAGNDFGVKVKYNEHADHLKQPLKDSMICMYLQTEKTNNALEQASNGTTKCRILHPTPYIHMYIHSVSDFLDTSLHHIFQHQKLFKQHHALAKKDSTYLIWCQNYNNQNLKTLLHHN